MAFQSHHYALHWLLADTDHGVQELPGTARQGRSAPGAGLWLKYPDSKLSDSIILRLGVLEGNANFSVVRGDPASTRGWRSRYYGEKEPAISSLLGTDQTSVCFWSYFGFKSDNLRIADGALTIASGNWNTTIDLNQINK